MNKSTLGQADTPQNRAIYTDYILLKFDTDEQVILEPKIKKMIDAAASIEFAQKLASFSPQGVKDVLATCEEKGLLQTKH